MIDHLNDPLALRSTSGDLRIRWYRPVDLHASYRHALGDGRAQPAGSAWARLATQPQRDNVRGFRRFGLVSTGSDCGFVIFGLGSFAASTFRTSLMTTLRWRGRLPAKYRIRPGLLAVRTVAWLV